MSDHKYAVHCPTKESYDRLMKAYEKKGWRWCNNRIATDIRENNRNKYKEKTYIMFCDGFSFGSNIYYISTYTNLTIMTVEEALARLGQYERGQEVLVSDNGVDWEKGIYLTTIEGAGYPYICVDCHTEHLFSEGKEFGLTEWKKIKPLEEPIKEMTMQEVETALGYKFKLIK